ncbi:hypothetical protein EUGRSUZ_A01673 [Eucalyptus grandis]|uniref:Uncharacterized protein n=2 Tax=Eucalyptus grandis TaxID=71139 RepID=A0ACC3M264_EUCGR|nr:hypothetical protein EUGRSUZ_A01673 [Eucalyptus grandis]
MDWIGSLPNAIPREQKKTLKYDLLGKRLVYKQQSSCANLCFGLNFVSGALLAVHGRGASLAFTRSAGSEC